MQSNTIYNNLCNAKTGLTLNASQAQNEPDIGTSTVTSSGGSFDIASLTVGDSVGYAIMNTSVHLIIITFTSICQLTLSKLPIERKIQQKF